MAIGFCGLDDVSDLMRFIREHWSAEHIMGHSRALMDWQHRDDAAGRYNFLLSRRFDGVIDGILGFIPMSRFDPAVADNDETIWFAMWKVLDDAPTGTGLRLIRELERRYKPKWIGTVGLNAHVRQIYNALGYRTASLERWYRLNAAVAAPKLIHRPDGWPTPPQVPGTTALVPVLRPDLVNAAQSPRKTPESLIARYIDHPFYNYRIYAVEGAEHAVIVTRLCEHEGATALRIVDLLGPVSALAGSAAAFDALLAETGAEYVDFYLSGGDNALPVAGFTKHAIDAPLILPSYFEPFDRSNVDVVYAIKGPTEGLTICKGDADQDRPNLLAITQVAR